MGRWKSDGKGGGYWDPNDSGPNQWTPPPGTKPPGSAGSTPSGGAPASTPQQQQQLSREQIRDMWLRKGYVTPAELQKFIGQYSNATMINPKSGKVRWDWGGGKVEELDMGHNFGTGGGQARWGSTVPRGSGGGAPVPGNGGAGGSGATTGHLGFPTDPAAQQLYQMLMQRAQQGLAVDRNDPAVRSQSDAYSANAERERRNFLADLAERGSPYGTGAQLGQERMTAEQVGQDVGAFESQLVGREIAARRDEIQHALDSMRHLLTTEQQLAMERELANLNAATQRYGISTNAQVARDRLGFEIGDREAYWDAVYGGLIS